MQYKTAAEIATLMSTGQGISSADMRRLAKHDAPDGRRGSSGHVHQPGVDPEFRPN
jgi:hypothetical protein